MSSSSEVVALRGAHQGFGTSRFYNTVGKGWPLAGWPLVGPNELNGVPGRGHASRLFFSARQECRFTVEDVFQYRFASHKFVSFWVKNGICPLRI